ncbi:MAG: PKD domain-containing protein, partial [Bacteroidota bacterium]
MRLHILLLLLLLSLCATLKAQFLDNTWVLGYAGADEEQDSFGLSVLTFSDNQLTIGIELEEEAFILTNNASISDNFGELQLYTNGLAIYNASHEIIENGDGMYVGELDRGYDYPQSSLMLPFPGNEDQVIIISTFASWNENYNTIVGDQLLYSIVDISANNSEGTVLVKNELLLDADFTGSKITAVRHANGRDWWFLYPLRDSNQFLTYLISPEGIERQDDQFVSTPLISGLGQAHYSLDGSRLVFYDGINLELGTYINVFDFDRCTGLLSNQSTLNIPPTGGSSGAAIAPNSRYLYIITTTIINQYDLWAEDIATTRDTVAIYDGFLDYVPANFFMGSLARDGKIYISSPNTVKSLTVIEYPNRQGEACYVNQHAIKLPVRNGFAVPNHPNFRLGPLDGSPCDTLGIDNIPLARFRTDQDTADYLSFYFQDLSDYEPADWFWDFGDGTTSQDTSPVHVYAQDGIYEVCLTVSNLNGSHSWCDTLYLGVV